MIFATELRTKQHLTTLITFIELRRHHRLEQVYLHHNQIKVIPRFGNCPNLKELHLGFNRIENLTDQDLENIPGIKVLDLRDNKVIQILYFGLRPLSIDKPKC